MVNHHGLVKMVMVAPGISGALYVAANGRVKVSDEHEALGWVLLQQMYEDEGRPELWAIYQDFQKAKRSGMEVDPLPDEYLPQEVLRRRAGHVPGKKKWTPPVLAPQPLDEGKKGQGRPRKDAVA